MSTAAPFTPSPQAPASVQVFGVILAGLGAAIARLFLRRPDLVVLTIPLWMWLNRSVRRLERAVAGPLRARAARLERGPARERVRRKVRARFSTQRGWLVRKLGWEVASFGTQLRHVLEQDEMQAALAERPAVGRVLRPICRMLGVEVAGLARARVVAEVTKGSPEVAEASPEVTKVKTRSREVKPRRTVRARVPVVPAGAWFEPPVKNRG